MSVREALALVGFEALARVDLGGDLLLVHARAAWSGSALGAGEEALVRLATGTAAAEVRALERARGPGIPEIREVRRGHGFAALALAPFRGRSLAREVARRGPLDAVRVAAVGAHAAFALGLAHEREVLHGAIDATRIALAHASPGQAAPVLLVGFGAGTAARAMSPDDDLIRLAEALWFALTGEPFGLGDPPRDAGPLATVLERGLRRRPELGFYPDAPAFEAGLERAARDLSGSSPTPAALKSDMSGHFGPHDLAGFLQMLERGRRSGRLELRGVGASGAFAIREGRIAAARLFASGRTGAEAAIELLGSSEGRFRLWLGPVPEGDADLNITAALLEAQRRRDEAGTMSPASTNHVTPVDPGDMVDPRAL